MTICRMSASVAAVVFVVAKPMTHRVNEMMRGERLNISRMGKQDGELEDERKLHVKI